MVVMTGVARHSRAWFDAFNLDRASPSQSHIRVWPGMGLCRSKLLLCVYAFSAHILLESPIVFIDARSPKQRERYSQGMWRSAIQFSTGNDGIRTSSIGRMKSHMHAAWKIRGKQTRGRQAPGQVSPARDLEPIHLGRQIYASYYSYELAQIRDGVHFHIISPLSSAM
ncbi:hypothetical protein M426DRAFT_147834 [Hypoxylon sp. CI-4A]|nr:hypothetical protein M426DRAFT_147834 [Hypoxylon sp. CI-4A]